MKICNSGLKPCGEWLTSLYFMAFLLEKSKEKLKNWKVFSKIQNCPLCEVVLMTYMVNKFLCFILYILFQVNMDQKPRLAFNTAQGACPMWVRKTVKLPEPQIKQTSASINLTENKIIRHIQKKSLKCEICLLKFSNGKFLKEHQQKIHVEKKIMLSKPKLSLNCMKCSTSFQNHQDLKEHIWTVHERKTVMKIDEFFQCPQCPQTCPTKHGLTVHIGHSHEKQKSYICSICDKEVQSKRNLSNHMAKIHEGKKPYRLESFQVLKFQI